MAARPDRDRCRLVRLRALARRAGSARSHRRPLAARLTGCALGLVAGTALACPGPDEPCRVEGGAYYALPPPGWNGREPLPATIFFHGYMATAAGYARDEAFRAAFAREGVLLVLPEGLGKTWSHQGAPSRARDEIAFSDAVRADLLRRFPVDPDRLLVTGFSQGGSMAWDLACRRGGAYAAAYAPVAGAFWEPLPASCPGGPVNLRHAHGLADGTVPMAGRKIRQNFRQGDVRAGFAVLRRTDGCGEARERVEEAANGAARCEVWDRCTSGRELRLCLHPGGHEMPGGWVGEIHAWVRGLPDWGGGAAE